MPSSYSKDKLLYEGKAKKVFSIKGKKDLYIQEFKDDATAFNALKKGTITNKGVINNQIASTLFMFLGKNRIQTHFVEKLSDREMLVKKLKIIPIEVIVRNIATGSLLKKTNLKDGTVLKVPIAELYYKDDSLGDPLINEEHALAMKLGTLQEINHLKKQALKINELLKPFFKKIGLKLVDFKLEFGKDSKGKILLGDEISPDTCRFWDVKTNEKLDKDRFRFDLGKVDEAYSEVLKRISSK
jgi:phosphoribosylaminoimidazole-succinocarboxamide synthase